MKKLTISFLVISLFSLIVLTISLTSCLQLITDKISVQVSRGTGNNYYEISIITNMSFTPDNTNDASSFNINDTNNIVLEVTSGNLGSGYVSWVSSKDYTYGLYFVVVKIDKTGDNKINAGDEYSFKYIILTPSSNTINFSDNDTWYSLN
jgi:hypothetical protein